jgi:hypothetical protein
MLLVVILFWGHGRLGGHRAIRFYTPIGGVSTSIACPGGRGGAIVFTSKSFL